MNEINDNPLKKIFKITPKGICSEEINSVENINNFFKYIKNPKIPEKSRSTVIEDLILKIKKNRYLCEYFSSYENQSIYFILFNLYLQSSTTDVLKTSIHNLLNELRNHIEIKKQIFDFLFQKMASLYRQEEKLSPENIYPYLSLLNIILGDTENSLPPRNYFCCSGKGRFDVDLSKLKIKIGCSFSIIINFKIGSSTLAQENPDKALTSTLIEINFSNGYSIKFDLKYPMFLIVSEIRESFIKTLPIDEWINLIINVTVNDSNKIHFYFFVNGENHLTPFKMPKSAFENKDYIDSIHFFNNFYGEVGSMTLLSQKDYGLPGVNSSEFLQELKLYKEGLWKKKKVENFMELLSSFDSIGKELTKSKTVAARRNTKTEKKNDKEEENKNKLIDNLIFIFTPFNCNEYDRKIAKNFVENATTPLTMYYDGNIRPHKFYRYQKKLKLTGVITNILPIGEMFLLYPQILNGKNFLMLLKIIKSILSERKGNMKYLEDCQFFQIMSLFIEKYPKTFFTSDILDAFVEIGKCMFTQESMGSNYFKDILLNEKILSKYSEDLQIKFWNQIMLFCQSDSSQIEWFMNMNRICLILRFYDINKYTEMCCERHLKMIKDEYIGSKTIMNPPMMQKLSYIENIMELIINSQDPTNSFSLFKLLTLDLSPCLTKFILNVFIKAFQKKTTNEWNLKFVNELTKNNFEAIIINTFIHSLPEIRLDILKLMNEIYLTKTKKNAFFNTFEKNIKYYLLPDTSFYISNKDIENTNKEYKTKPIEQHRKKDTKRATVVFSEVLPFGEETTPTIDEKASDDTKKMLGKSVMVTADDYPKNNPPPKIVVNKKDTLKSSSDKKPAMPPNSSRGGEDFKSRISILESQKGKIMGMGGAIPKMPTIKEKDEKPKKIPEGTCYTQRERDRERSMVVSSSQTNINNVVNNNANKNNQNKINKIEETPSTAASSNSPYAKTINRYQDEILIFKENLYNEYIDKLYYTFLNWALEHSLNNRTFNTKKVIIQDSNALESLLYLINEIDDIALIVKTFSLLESLIENSQNSYKILSNETILITLLDIIFKYFKSEQKSHSSCYNKGKSIIVSLFLNSLSYVEKTQHFYPYDKIDIFFIWGDLVLQKELSRKEKDNVFEFLNEILFECLTSFKIKCEPLMHFNLNDPNFEPSKNFYVKNYLVLMTHLFRFSFHFKHDFNIKKSGISSSSSSSKKIINAFEEYTTGMKVDLLKGEKIIEQWIDYPFFDDIYRRLSYMWTKIKNYNEKEGKKNTLQKYENLLNKVILDKNKKNIYQKELELLCYEQNSGEIHFIMPLIKSIPIALMSILSSSKVITDFLHWLKEFKRFTKFLIIATTNLTRANQLEWYNKIQEKCQYALIACLSFFQELHNNSLICKPKIDSYYRSILLFCFMIVKYQFEYKIKHTTGLKKLKPQSKYSRNDLVESCSFILFTELIKDRAGNPLLNLSILEQLHTCQYANIVSLVSKQDWADCLFENKIFKAQLMKYFFTLEEYAMIIKIRFELINGLKEEKELKYKDEILSLLPLYEKELLKYSNNSLEKNKKIKKIYQKFKKQSFSWRGYWSDRKLFYENIDKLKLKLINHYTKTLMKPILIPILDIYYYLPSFTGFDPQKLFNKNNGTGNYQNNFRLILDIDKILRLSEQNQIAMNTIKEQFGEKKQIKENFLRKIYTKSNPELADSLLKIANNLDLGKEEEFAVIEKDTTKSKTRRSKKYFLSCLVKTSHHIKGVCFIEANQLNFKVFLNQKTGSAMNDIEIGFTKKDDDYDQERQTCFGSYFIYHPKDKDLYKKSIDYTDIKWIFRRRYYYKNSALEIYTFTNKTFYFNFKYEEDRETVLTDILHKLSEPLEIIDDLKSPKDIFDNVIGYDNSSRIDSKKKGLKKIKLSKKIEAWKDWEITNYEMLMWLNIYANRSFNDISQYPVFPWILSNYKDPIKNDQSDDNFQYRDLSLPMGMLALDGEGEKRKDLFMETFDTLKSDSDAAIKPYIYGSNYSNPMYVCHFMMRLFPFTHISIELQGHKFDDPNRLFFSVQNSFYCSCTQKTDVRELIPEFFYLPEMFLNVNDLNMGVQENGNKVNDVLTPCDNNPYEFILTMKSALESDKISASIQNWIDLIFGSKAKGKEAEAAYNLFTEASYQESIDIKTVNNKESYLRLVEFGLIPTQIMCKDCGKKEKKEDIIKGREITDSKAKLLKYTCKIDQDDDFYKIKNDILALKVGEFTTDKITIVLNNNLVIEKKISYSLFDKLYSDEITNRIQLPPNINCMKDFYSSDATNNKAIQFCHHGKSIIMGGFYDGKITIFPLESKEKSIELSPLNDGSPILAVSIDQDEEFLFVGNSFGNVAIIKILPQIGPWETLNIITDQMSAISHIHCNKDLNVWASATIDGYINLYTLPTCKLVRSVKVPTTKCSYVFVISSPLPSFVCISDEQSNSEIFVYSINGKLIVQQQQYVRLSNPIILKDLNSNEYLAYVGNDAINIHNLPNLEMLANIDVPCSINSICPSMDMKELYAINKSGTEIMVIRDEFKRTLRTASLVI